MGSAKKYGVVFSHDKCNGCLDCEKACIESHKSSVATGMSRIKVTKSGEKYKATVCVHCETCPPSEVCPSALLEFHDDKKHWTLDEHRCFACMACIPRCPYEAVFFEGEFGIETAYMCDLCNGDPKCVAACKTGALEYGPSREECGMSEMVEDESAAEPLREQKPTEGGEKVKSEVEEFPLPDWVAPWAREAPKIVVRAPGPKSKEIIKIDRDYVSYAYDRCFTFTIDKASGASVMDADGNILLDFSSGIAVQNAGWTHYKVSKAIQDQAAKLIHSMANDAYFDKEAHFAKLLSEISPNKALKGTFFGNSGGEAVEAAFKLSRYHTKRNEHVAFFGSYHGRVGAGLALTSKLKLRYSYGPMSPGIVFTPFAYCYRCAFKQTYPECGMWCMDYLENQVLTMGGTTNQIASIFVEPIQGEGGYVVPPKEFLPSLKKICEGQGALLVMDEVQTGFARTGKMFACEHFNTVPDILVMGKALGGGVPLGAIIAKHDIMRKWRPGSHSSTFGGNAITMAAGLAHVQAIVEENLADRAARLGDYAMKLLKEIQQRREIIGDVRGRGLMIGVELVKNQYTKEPHEATNIQGKCWRAGLMTITSGIYGNVFRIAPPLCISKAQLEKGFEIFEQALKDEEEFLKIGTSSPPG